jgi:hypothetical protein
VAGADELCRAAAATVDLTGEFVAWLSDSEASAGSRLEGSRGWELLDGRTVTDLPSELVARGPRVPIALTEANGDLRSPGVLVFSGTKVDGSVSELRCLDWTSGDGADAALGGDGSQGGGGFTDFTSRFCSLPRHLYCFEIGKSVELPIEPATAGPFAFVTEGQVRPTTGLADADALCASEAATAGLSGTFLALLSTSLATAVDRFTPNLVYVRVDGVRFGNITSSMPDTFLNVTATGAVLPADEVAWTGGSPTSTSTATCTDWTGLGMGGRGFPQASDTRAYVAGGDSCDQAHHVYCFQQ